MKNHIGGGSHKDGGEPKVHKRHNCRLNNSTADKSDICVLSVVVLFVDKACKESEAARGGNVHDNAYPAAARAHGESLKKGDHYGKSKARHGSEKEGSYEYRNIRGVIFKEGSGRERNSYGKHKNYGACGKYAEGCKFF